MRYWLGLLIFEFISGALAGIIFQSLDRNIAGYIAGSLFFAVGILALYLSRCHSVQFRLFNIIISGVYFFGFSGPLWGTRLFTPSTQPVVSVLGVPMQDFHVYSVQAYRVLMVMTVMQIIFIWLKNRKSSRPIR